MFRAGLWTKLSKLVVERVQVATEHKLVRPVFVAEFPQLLGLFQDFLLQLQQHHATLLRGSAGVEEGLGLGGAGAFSSAAYPAYSPFSSAHHQLLDAEERSGFVASLGALRADFKEVRQKRRRGGAG